MNENETATIEAPKPAKVKKAKKVKAAQSPAKLATPAKAVKTTKPKARKTVEATTLRLPQIRILRALAKEKAPAPRAFIAKKAGFTPISGTMSRALNGSKKNGVTGLIESNYVKWVKIGADEFKEDALQITGPGKRALKSALGDAEKLPKLRDKDASTNHRYNGNA